MQEIKVPIDRFNKFPYVITMGGIYYSLSSGLGPGVGSGPGGLTSGRTPPSLPS